MKSKEWLAAYKTEPADERQFLFRSTYVQGHCFPQPLTPDPASTCIRCGAKVIFSRTEAQAPPTSPGA